MLIRLSREKLTASASITQCWDKQNKLGVLLVSTTCPPRRALPKKLTLFTSRGLQKSAMSSFGQIFSRDTQAIFYNWKPSPVQRMLDFDFLCGKLLIPLSGAGRPQALTMPTFHFRVDRTIVVLSAQGLA